MKNWPRLRILLLAFLGAAGIFAPWGSSLGGGAWIAAASWVLAHHLVSGLEAASRLVTAVAAGLAVLGAALRVMGQRRGGALRMQAVGLTAVCVPLSLLMRVGGAACFLAGCCVVLLVDLALQVRPAGRADGGEALGDNQGRGGPARRRWAKACARETFSTLSAAVWLTFGWQYNAQLLTRLILVAGGVALIARAVMTPSQEHPSSPPPAGREQDPTVA